MTSQNYVVWKDAFSVGSAAIDAQHKGMFGLLNDLYNALQEGRSQKDISEIVEKARQYAKQHFASEEALWAKSRCPGLEEHKAVHQAYTRQVEEIWQSSGQPLEDTAYGLFFFLKEWWLSHITGMDAQYASSVRTVPSH
jgi:hemerythrin